MSRLPTDDELPPEQYCSYNGMGRVPMIWGIPYMVGLGIMCLSLLPAMMLGMYVGGAGWLFSFVGVPLALFAKSICSTDDRALAVFAQEAKWALIKKMGGNAKYNGGAFLVTPTNYTRKRSNVKCCLEAAICG